MSSEIVRNGTSLNWVAEYDAAYARLEAGRGTEWGPTWCERLDAAVLDAFTEALPGKLRSKLLVVQDLVGDWIKWLEANTTKVEAPKPFYWNPFIPGPPPVEGG